MIARFYLAPLTGLALVAAHSSALWLPGDTPSEAPAFRAELTARLPDTATGMGAAVCGSWLYLLGGHRGEPHRYAAEFQSADFARLDLADLTTFERLEPIEQGVQGAQLVAWKGGVFRLGGMRAKNRDGEESALVSLDEFARFNPAQGAWIDLAPLPGPRSSHAAAVVDGTLYVVGGWDIAGPMGKDSTFHGETWAVSLGVEGAEWRTIATPFHSRALAAAALEGQLVAVGGMDPQGKATSAVHVLETASGTWSRGPDLPESGFGVAAVASAGRVWAAGGKGVLWSWAPGESAWHEEGRGFFGRLFGQLVARADGDLLLVGGTRAGAQVRAVERLRVRQAPQDQPVEASAPVVAAPRPVAHFKVASPALGRNRQAAELVGDRLFLFGGNAELGQHDFAPENFLDEGWAFDLRTLEWTPAADLPVRRQSLQTAQLAQGAVAAVGGFGHDGERTRSFADVWRYSSAADVWKRQEPLPAGRTQFALVGDERQLWILGGLDYVQGRGQGADFVHTTEVLRCDLTAGDALRFEASPVRLPAGRRAFGSAVIGSTAYLVGGLADGFERVEECLEFDLATGEFREFPAPRAPRISPELVALDGRLYLIGGASARGGDGSGSDTSIEVYDPALRRWSVWTEDFGLEPAHLRAFAHQGRLLLVSTQFPDPAAIELLWLDPAEGSRP